MKDFIVALAIVPAIGTAHGESVLDWAGKRTGLKQGICETFGECERRRTEQRREEAERAEQELEGGRDNLSAQRERLTEAEEKLGGVRGELAMARAEIAKKINAIAGRLNEAAELSAAARDTFNDLIEENNVFIRQAAVLEAAFRRVDQSAPTLLAGFSREGQNELKKALVSYGREDGELANKSANLIQRRGRQAQELLRASFTSASAAYRRFETVSVGDRAEGGREALIRLRDDIDRTLELMREAQGLPGDAK